MPRISNIEVICGFLVHFDIPGIRYSIFDIQRRFGDRAESRLHPRIYNVMSREADPKMKKFLHEPLFHFLLLGALLFGAYAVLDDGDAGAEAGVITITEGDIDWLIAAWSRQWRRPPTETELRGLIADRVREEVLYREALAMGLDRDDQIVRRRLAQKMEFLTEDLALMVEPNDSTLEAFYQDNADRYRIPEQRAFTHVIFSVDRRGDAAFEDARAALVVLQGDSAAVERASDLGDRFLQPFDYSLRSEERVARDFGGEFAAGVFAVEPGEWTGPIRSSFGVHLVRVAEWTAPVLPPLADVVDRVRTDLDVLRREEANEAVFQALLQRYDVQVDESAIQARLAAAPAGDGG